MKFGEAYKSIGYTLDNVQTDWSALEEGRGVAISIWWAEVRMESGRPVFSTKDLKRDDTPATDARLGSRKRIKHLQKAWNEFGGWVDAIILTGVPSEGYGSAEPWDPAKCGGQWRIRRPEEDSGHFLVELVALTEKDTPAL
jgi:hypothetical protein